MMTRNPETGKLIVLCDECGWRIRHVEYDILDGEISVEDGGLDSRQAEQHLCPECFDKIWKNAVGYHCHTDCRTKPCAQGRECWVNPWPRILYLCFIGKRIGPFHPGVGPGMALLEAI